MRCKTIGSSSEVLGPNTAYGTSHATEKRTSVREVDPLAFLIVCLTHSAAAVVSLSRTWLLLSFHVSFSSPVVWNS